MFNKKNVNDNYTKLFKPNGKILEKKYCISVHEND